MRARGAALAAMASALAFVGGAGGGTLHNRVDYPLGQYQPWAVAIGDLNGDGKPDLAVANDNSQSVSVLLGKGDGTFAVSAHYAAGFSPHAVAIEDLNADGKPDLMVANYDSNSLSVLLGNGDGTFTPKSTPTTGTGPFSLASGDLNGDGVPDLAVANSGSDTVSVLIGNGDGTFTTKSTPATGSYPESVAIGDLNGDGKPDLAVANDGSNTVSVLLGNGDGTFTAKSTDTTGVQPDSIGIGDLNGDGKPDLAVTNVGSNTVSVLLGNGDGTFSTKSDYTTGTSPNSVAIGDLNGDGKPDLAVADAGSNTVSVLLADATPPAVTCQQPDGIWHAANAEIACSASDDFSGLAKPTDNEIALATTVPLGTETANAPTNAYTVCDKNNNCTTVGPIWGNKVDRKGPDIDMLSMEDGDVYPLGSEQRAIFACTDRGSGVAVCGADQPSGTRLDTSHEGTYDFQVTAVDNTNNVSSLTIHYKVWARPAPTALSPGSGLHGSVVTITGTHLEHVELADFTAAFGSQVPGSVVGTPTATTLKVMVPDTAVSGPIDLISAPGIFASTKKFLVKPAITSVTPSSDPVGQRIEIDGYGFDPSGTAVKFGGVAATSFTVDSANVIHATVPAGAHTGGLTVTTVGGTATWTKFSVTPTAQKVSATTAHTGSALTVSGTGLTDLRSVTFRGVDRPVRAFYVRISSTQLRVVVPNGARTGAATVTTAGGSAQTPVITITG